ncbi:hypothetical protein ANN_18063 [Periplaneta americana]|uniref:DDE-1 domain-containing protein n=1 Tax=Periplaneta americana TaxID=6978 RepID=A0ABQ8SMQ8_PERAM|nr:hypothetical protein ANN_18063 [Periplaneta americana]
MAAHLEKHDPIGAIYSCSNNGWINETLFLVWLKHFQQHVKATEDDPVLLVCDNHASHISLEVFNFCRDNHITMVTLPSHTSHRLQPLDLTFFGPLKNGLFREYDLFMINHAHERITMSDIAGLLNKAYVKVATMEEAVSGFRSAGIVPLNPEKFSAEDFAPAQEFRNLIVEEEQEQETTPSTSGSSKEANASTDGRLTSGFSPNSSHVVEKDPEGEPTPSTSSHHTSKEKIRGKKGKERSFVKEKGNDECKKKLNMNGDTKKPGKGKKPKKSRRIVPEETDESDYEVMDLSDDDEMDSLDGENGDKCLVCDEFGQEGELWYRCTSCGYWSHAVCSGWDFPDGYQ